MKKLMIVAAVAMLGVAANAAVCNWDVPWAYAIDTSNPTYTGSETFKGTYWILESVATTLDASSIKVDNTGKLSYDDTAFTVKQDGTAINASYWNAQATGLSSSDNGHYLTLVIYDENYKYYGTASGVLAGIADEPAPSDANAITFQNDGDYVGAFTKAEAVPEPTSGLLLLLGVAGLALRRRRA